jgi:hypothetical protein
MQTTSPYWNQFEFDTKKSDKVIAGTLGFTTAIPWPEPVTVGAIYSGDGAMPDRRTICMRPWGEYFAVNNKIPSTGGVPLINTQEPRFQYSRDKFCYVV